MDATRINPSTVWSSPGFPYHQAVVEPPGRRVHVTGQVAWTPELDVVGPDDPEAQTHYTIDNIERILDELGGRLSDVVASFVFYVRDEDLGAITHVRKERFELQHGPTATGIKVAGLVHPALLVEITVIAVIPEERFKAG